MGMMKINSNYVRILVERDRLKKKFYNKQGWPVCPACFKILGDDKFCRYCGQRVDDGSEE